MLCQERKGICRNVAVGQMKKGIQVATELPNAYHEIWCMFSSDEWNISRVGFPPPSCADVFYAPKSSHDGGSVSFQGSDFV